MSILPCSDQLEIAILHVATYVNTPNVPMEIRRKDGITEES